MSTTRRLTDVGSLGKELMNSAALKTLLLTLVSVLAAMSSVGQASALPLSSGDGENGGRTYYVDAVDGSDGRSGLSPDAAWKTLSRVTAASLRPGDSVLLRRGQTFRGGLEVAESGAAGAVITVGAHGSGASPIVTGDCIRLSGSRLLVHNLTVRDCAWAGITVSGDHNRVTRNRVTRNVTGVHVRQESSSARVTHNVIVDNDRMSVNTVGGDDDSGAFGVLLRGNAAVVAHNRISGHSAPSFDYGTDGAAIEIYGATNSRAHHNVAQDNHAFTELGDPASAGNTFAYNVVTSSDEGASFLVTRGGESSWGPVQDTLVEHNTVVLTGPGSQGFVCHAGCSAEILTLRSNIIQAVAKVGYADGPFVEAHNLFWQGQIQFEIGSSSIVAPPRFVAPKVGNFRLRATSRAVDSAPATPWKRDVRGGPVPQDGDGDGRSRPDRGAWERRP